MSTVTVSCNYECERLLRWFSATGAVNPAEPKAATHQAFAEGMPRPTCRVANGRVAEDALEEMWSRCHVVVYMKGC